MSIDAVRREYDGQQLEPHDIDGRPLDFFRAWLAAAVAADPLDGNAVCLSTVDASGAPHARMVLVKGLDEGVLFFTNRASAKGRELAADPRAAITCFWARLSRQVRIEGSCESLAQSDVEAYFASRPTGSRIAAAISPQSQEIPDRNWLEQRYQRQAQAFPEGPPCPPDWGGYRLVPSVWEFWQGRPSRLHDRVRCERMADNAWRSSRLAP